MEVANVEVAIVEIANLELANLESLIVRGAHKIKQPYA